MFPTNSSRVWGLLQLLASDEKYKKCTGILNKEKNFCIIWYVECYGFHAGNIRGEWTQRLQ